MATSFIDLHCHSTASDGTLSPTEVVNLAKQAGVSAMSLTDHDTIAGVREASDEAARQGIDFISGIEISCEFNGPGTMHLLGYGVDPNSASLANLAAELIGNRNDRNPRIVRRLNELGVSVTMREWEEESGGQVVGRPHLATILVRKGYVSSVKQAFDKFLGQDGAAYFDKDRVPPRRALELTYAAGGISVLAHPYQLRCPNDAELETVVKNMIDLGLVGLEVMHSDHDTALVERYTKLAERLGLVKTGGSDYHGASKKSIDFGWSHGQRVPREFYDHLVEVHRKHHRSATQTAAS